MDLNAKQRFKGPIYRSSCPGAHKFSIVVVINEADTLSRDAQAALRRTMEKYMSNLRIILCAKSTSRLIAPIRSRCLLIRVAAPSTEEVIILGASCLCQITCIPQMQTVLEHVAKKLKFDLPPEASSQIAEDAAGNMRKALLVFEALKMQS